jgi:hypothetical protein
MGLRSGAVVELEHAAEPLSASDRALSDRRILGRDERVAQSLVGPFLMIVVDKRADSGPEPPFAEGHDARQALGSDRPDKSLGKRVQIRTPRGQAHECHTTVAQQIPEGGGVERVSVENQVLRVAEEAIVRVGEIPRHLSYPEFVPVDS